MTGLSRKKQEAIVALLSQKNVDEAARSVDMPARTLYRWMKEEEFDAALRDAQRATFKQAVARLSQMCPAAVTTLGRVMADPNTPASTRGRVALGVVTHTTKAIEIEDVEARVSKLERAALTKKNPKR